MAFFFFFFFPFQHLKAFFHCLPRSHWPFSLFFILCHVSFFSGCFHDLLFIFGFHQFITRMCLGVVYLLYLGFTEPLESVNVSFLQLFFSAPIFLSTLKTLILCMLNLLIASFNSPQTLFFLFSPSLFSLSPSDRISFVDIFILSLPDSPLISILLIIQSHGDFISDILVFVMEFSFDSLL